jgi:4-amino-4-deoxy-L-arabinose transferase-like glycosyltransferase
MRKPFIPALLLVCGICFFLNLGSTPLLEPDEGRNAEVAREILVTGDWVTPHLNFARKLNKPILLFSASALSMRLFGVNEFAARVPSAVAAVLGVVAVYLLGRRMFGERSGLFAALILATSPIYIAFSRLVIFDMMLAAFFTLAMLFFYLGFTENAPGKKRLYYLVFYAATALAVLAKGLIGIVLPLAIIGLFLLATRGLGRIREMEILRGPLLFLAVAAPWYVLVSVSNPEFPRNFFITEHVTRYTTETFHRIKPFWYYILVLVAGLFPWILSLPWAIAASWRDYVKEGSGRRQEMLFLALWAGFIFIFFTFSRAKQPAYLLPLFPSVALLIGKFWGDYSLRRNKIYPFVILFGVTMLVFAAGLLTVNRIAPQRSSKAFAERVLAERRPGDAVVSYETFPSSFLFYMGERIPVVSDNDRSLGGSFTAENGRIDRGEKASFMSDDEFRALLSDRRRRIYIVAHKNHASRLASEADPGNSGLRLLLEGRHTALWVRTESP